MIEIVTNSDNTSKIQRMFGNTLNFSKESYKKYIEYYNKTEDQKKIAFDNFLRSCAGYCVATHVLGIGDRHPGNIMINRNGRFFHIDFGHFLGNTKQKLGIDRERYSFKFD